MKKLLFVFLAVWMALMPMGRVFASQEPPQEPLSVEYIEGSDGQRYILEEIKEITGASGTEASGCKTYTQGVSMKDIFGNVLWKYSWKINWCYDGTTITYKNRWRVVNIYGVGIQYMGDIANQTSGGVGQTFYWGYAQGRICQVVVNNTCFQQWYPWVEQKVFGNGAAQGSSGW